jgi:hypothetical protein
MLKAVPFHHSHVLDPISIVDHYAFGDVEICIRVHGSVTKQPREQRLTRARARPFLLLRHILHRNPLNLLRIGFVHNGSPAVGVHWQAFHFVVELAEDDHETTPAEDRSSV